MAKKRVKGSAENAKLNGEYGKHVRPWMKKKTSGKRRKVGKKQIKEGVVEHIERYDETYEYVHSLPEKWEK